MAPWSAPALVGKQGAQESSSEGLGLCSVTCYKAVCTGSGKQSLLHMLAVGLPVPAYTVPNARVPTQLAT